MTNYLHPRVRDGQSVSWVGTARIDNGDPVPCQIIWERQVIHDRSNLPRKDPNWTFVDKAGHYHACDGDGEYPTLDRQVAHHDCDGSCGGTCGGEGYDVTGYKCRICQDAIKPGLLHGEHTFVNLGMQEWRAKVTAFLCGRTYRSIHFTTEDGRVDLFGIVMDVAGEYSSDAGPTTELAGCGKLGHRGRSWAKLTGGRD